MDNSFYKSINEVDHKNSKLKSLFNLPGFNYVEKPIKITDNLNINNHFVYNDKVIDEKVFINFFGSIDNSEHKNYKYKQTNKETKKNKQKNKETKKIKKQKK